MNLIFLSKELGRNLGSRKRAAQFRAWLLAQSQPLTLDFAGVALMSHSFADELFGKLAAEHGAEIFRDRIILRGMKEDDRLLIRSVIVDRLTLAKAS